MKTKKNQCNHLPKQEDFNIWEPKYNQLYLNEILRHGHLINMLPIKKIKNLIDIGCGIGYMAYLLSRKGLHVTAVDISEKRLLLFKEIAKKSNIQQIHSDLFMLNCTDFDAILSQEVLEHLENYQHALNKITTFIKPDGYALFCVPYKENLNAKMIKCPICGQKYNKNGHLHSFSKEMFCNSIEKAGFKIIITRLIVSKRITKWFKTSKLIINNAFPFLLFIDRCMNYLFPHKAAYLAVLSKKK